MIDERYAKRALSQQLEVILRDDLVFWLVVNRGFDPDFVNHCTDVRRVVTPNKPLKYEEEEAIRGVGECGPET
jgi:hypothetical protein